MAGEKPILELTGVSKIYADGPTALEALAGITLAIPRGAFWAIMGPSGSGKSTLLHLLGLLDRPTVGNITIDGETVTADTDLSQLARLRRQKIGFIFQQFFLLPRLTALENVLLPALYARGNLNAARTRASHLLESVGLAARASHRPNELSGGEQQRVAIARALMNDPEIILADEPTGNLDSRTGAAILELIGQLHTKGKTIIIVTHDSHISRRAEKIVQLRDGSVV